MEVAVAVAVGVAAGVAVLEAGASSATLEVEGSKIRGLNLRGFV